MTYQIMRISSIAILSCFIISFTLGETNAQSSTNYRIKQSVVAQGGAATHSTRYKVNDVIGQSSPVGSVASTNFIVSSGFLKGVIVTMVAVDDTSKSAIPRTFTLWQNYPNPFNPTTTIRYTLPKSSSVTLTLYNLIGQKIVVLANETQPAGEYEVQWNAGMLPSGVYVCRIQAGEFVATRKLILLK